jgi:hypothetical protein
MVVKLPAAWAEGLRFFVEPAQRGGSDCAFLEKARAPKVEPGPLLSCLATPHRRLTLNRLGGQRFIFSAAPRYVWSCVWGLFLQVEFIDFHRGERIPSPQNETCARLGAV